MGEIPYRRSQSATRPRDRLVDLVEIQNRRSQSGWEAARTRDRLVRLPDRWPPSPWDSRPTGMEPDMLVEASSLALTPAVGSVPLDTVETAIAEIVAGRPVVVVDDEGRENEGDLIMAAEAVTPAWMAFIVRHTSGLVCVPMTGEALDRLGIPAMVQQNEDRMQTAFAVSVDAQSGVTTGI